MPASQRLDAATLRFLVQRLEADLGAMEGRRALRSLCREAELRRYLMELRVLLREAGPPTPWGAGARTP